jgi:hypothetical protein
MFSLGCFKLRDFLPRNSVMTRKAHVLRPRGKATEGFTDEERAAMRKHVQELKAPARCGWSAVKANGESDFCLYENLDPGTTTGCLTSAKKSEAKALPP